ncbi:MAG TPA: lysylphosphatidylglycerol synthase transmembrane domain-containing protein [Longimicrobiales bacterium]
MAPARPAKLLAPKRLLHLAVSLALLAWIARRVEWSEFGRTLRQTDPWFLSLSLAMSPVLIVISARKWQILLEARSGRTGLGACVNLYVIGYLFNNVLPTNVGGDLVRGWLMGRRTGDPFTAVAAVFLERLTGFTALVAIAVIALPFGPAAGWHAWVYGYVAAVTVVFGAAVWALLDGRAARTLQRFERHGAVRKLLRFHDALDAYRTHPRVLVRCLGLSLMFYAGAALNIYFSARAFGGEMRLGETALATPVILLVTMLPISFGGVGLSEWAHIYALGRFGVPTAVGLSTALLLRAKGVLLGVVGSVVYPLQQAGSLRRAAEAARGAQGGEDATAGGPSATAADVQGPAPRVPRPDAPTAD